MKLTIGIKALNEERHIEKTIQSALAAAAPFNGEVVLADSGSRDRTIEIASRYPVRIVQLANPEERSCGAGAQLAYQSARGEYFYLLDGDMVIDPDFIPAAIARLDQQADLAGVGGRVVEMNTEGEGFKIRAQAVQNDRNWLPGIVDRLDCGGLYRSEAIRDVGYFADRNLHAFEEFELAARLRSKGWKLARIDQHAVDHHGHQMSGYKLLLRRIRSGYAGAPGEVLRGAIGQNHLGVVLSRMSHIKHGLAVIVWWALLLGSLFLPLPGLWRLAVTAALLLLPLAFLSVRRSSLRLGLYSLAAWNVSAYGLVSGFFRRRTKPSTPLAARDIPAGTFEETTAAT